MARIIDPFAQFLDDNGDPLVDGFLKFVESGTNNTDKDTFADVNESIANANPVPLDGAGRCPNVFGTGAYNVISYTNAMVQIQQFDPVSADASLGAFSDWDSVTIYDEGDIVIGSDSLYYRSITTDNQNQNPISSPGQWEQFKFIGIWNTNITYTTGDSVYGSNGFLYVSRSGSNLGNDPISDFTNLEQYRFVGIWNTNFTYAAGDSVYASDGFLYLSRVGSNTGNDPISDATNWRPGALNRYTKGADIASANDLPLPDGVSADVTGTTDINGVADSLPGTFVVYQFDDVLTLKHNTAASAGFDSIDLPGDLDITTKAGDIIVLESQGSGNLYRTISYTRSDGATIALIVEEDFTVITAGSSYRYSFNESEAATTNSAYTKITPYLIIQRSGTYQFVFDMKATGTGASVEARIYRNAPTGYSGDVAFGTEQTTNSLIYVTKTESLAVNAGDIISIYAKVQAFSSVEVIDFKIESLAKQYG